MPASILQAVLSLAALGNGLICVARAERMADGTYVVHRGDMPAELGASHVRVPVKDTLKARMMQPGDWCLIAWRGDSWTVEARE